MKVLLGVGAKSMLRIRFAFALVGVLFLAGCKALLYSNLEESEANKIVAELSTNGIVAEKIIDSRSGLAGIKVNRADFSRSVRILESAGLPMKSFVTVDQVFTGDGLVTTPTEERARLRYAIGEELARSISELDGILSARVHIVMPEESRVPTRTGREKSRSKASVLIRRRSEVQLEHLSAKIKHFVSNSVEDLEYQDVAVIDFVVDTRESDLPTVRDELNGTSETGGLSGEVIVYMIVAFATLIVVFLIVAVTPKKLLHKVLFRGRDSDNPRDEESFQRRSEPIRGNKDSLVPERTLIPFSGREK